MSSALGEYLRARRALVRPEHVGLPRAGRRRVPGLRREELAILAGISSDYLLRLEQGRDHNPSAQVLDALARALQLDEAATSHMRALVQPIANLSLEPEHAPASIARMIASWTNTPAYVLGRRMDVLAANRLASALTPVFRPGNNLVRATFLDRDLRALIADWDDATRRAVACLRTLVGPDVDDPQLTGLVRDLSLQSDPFRRLWARHDAGVSAAPASVFNHPRAGVLELQAETLVIPASPRQLLIIYHADAASPSAGALARLGHEACSHDS
jgi:transcriptional regulator with XRE-family HTH domain